ncbi:MAG: hypothetical protein JST35_08315 [Armatimonadetes bacterium]|nr:hypothetical protein [Armatimonadota bacterium]
MKISTPIVLALALVVAAGCSGQKKNASELGAAKAASQKQDRDLTQAEHQEVLKDFVQKNSASKDPAKQDLVTRSRIELGYQKAAKKDFSAAREVFLTASSEHKGTAASSPDFGGLKDQAAYQAAVCLVGMGKKKEAMDEFRRFLKDFPKSPLATAAYRRLTRLNGGTSLPQDDALYQEVVTKREKNLKLELAMCGPKCIENLLPRLGKPAMSYEKIAKLCKTTQQGTTMSQMKGALDQLGLKSYGFELNRKDFSNCPTPAILLAGDHYVVLVKVTTDSMTIYDTLFNSERTVKLPPSDTPDFSATVLTLSLPSVS